MWCMCMSTQHARTCTAVALNSLQCVAVCCSVLQCVAVRCSALKRVALWCSVLQCVALCCTVLHCVALCCSGSQYKPTSTVSDREAHDKNQDFDSLYMSSSLAKWRRRGRGRKGMGGVRPERRRGSWRRAWRKEVCALPQRPLSPALDLFLHIYHIICVFFLFKDK